MLSCRPAYNGRPSAPRHTSSRVYTHLPAAEDQPLLLWRNTRLLLDFLLDPSDLDTRRVKKGSRICAGCLMEISAHVPCRLDQHPARSLKQGTQDQKVSPVSIFFIHRGRIAQMKDAFGPPDTHQITRTSLPVRVYVDERGSERGVLGILRRAPASLDNGVIKCMANRGYIP